MRMKDAANVLAVHEVRQLAGKRQSDFVLALTKLRFNERQTESAIDLLLAFARDDPSAAMQARRVQHHTFVARKRFQLVEMRVRACGHQERDAVMRGIGQVNLELATR